MKKFFALLMVGTLLAFAGMALAAATYDDVDSEKQTVVDIENDPAYADVAENVAADFGSDVTYADASEITIGNAKGETEANAAIEAAENSGLVASGQEVSVVLAEVTANWDEGEEKLVTMEYESDTDPADFITLDSNNRDNTPGGSANKRSKTKVYRSDGRKVWGSSADGVDVAASGKYVIATLLTGGQSYNPLITKSTGGGSSSSGCNAGVAGLGMIPVAFALMALRRKSR